MYTLTWITEKELKREMNFFGRNKPGGYEGENEPQWRKKRTGKHTTFHIVIVQNNGNTSQATVRLHHRKTNVYFHTFWLLWEPRRKWITGTHQCCDQLTAVKTRYLLTSITWPYRGIRRRPIEFKYFFEVIRWQVTSFQMITGLNLVFLKLIWNMLRLCHYGPALLRFWFQTNLGHGNSASYLKGQAGKTFSYQGHTLVTLYVQFLCSDWSKFDRWVHAETLCIIKLVYFDSWSWQSLVSTCDVFNCLFHWMYKVKYSCYQESSVIHNLTYHL